MTLDEFIFLYNKNADIGETREELDRWNKSGDQILLQKLREYPRKMQFYMIIQKEALNTIAPYSNLTPNDELLKDVCTWQEINNIIYVLMCIYDIKKGRTLPPCTYELKRWVELFGIDNVRKYLPVTEII